MIRCFIKAFTSFTAVVAAALAAPELWSQTKGNGDTGTAKLTSAEALTLARAYMAEEDGGKRKEILDQVSDYDAGLDEIALALRPHPGTASARTGYIPADAENESL